MASPFGLPGGDTVDIQSNFSNTLRLSTATLLLMGITDGSQEAACRPGVAANTRRRWPAPAARCLRAVQADWLAHASPPGTLRLPAVAVLAAKAAGTAGAEPPPARLHPHGCAAVLPPGRPLGIARGDPASPSQQGDGFARGVPPLGLPPPARRLRAVQPGWLAHASPPGTLRLPAVAVLAAKAAGTAGAEPPPARRHPHGLRRSAASGPPPWDRQRRSRFAATARWRLRLRGSRPSDTRIRPIGADAPLERSWARFASPPSRGRLGLRRLRPLARSSASPGGVRPRCVRPDRPYTAGADTTITFPYSCGKRLPTQIFTHVSYASF